jgi:nucleoid-associated protein YgaU
MAEKDFSEKVSRSAQSAKREMTSKEKIMAELKEAQRATRRSATAKASEPEMIAEHTVATGETLSHIAQKYYGSAVKEKWMAIYKANKETIGDNPGLIKPGQILKIPTLAE